MCYSEEERKVSMWGDTELFVRDYEERENKREVEGEDR